MGTRTRRDDSDESRLVKVLVVDDHPLFRRALRIALAETQGLTVVGEARDGAEAVELAGRLVPDVVLMDVSMPVVDGIEATRLIKNGCPEVSVLALTVHDDSQLVRAMVGAGAAGYLTKDAPADEVIQAVLTVAAGGAALSRTLLGTLSAKRRPTTYEVRHAGDTSSGLTPRELHVLRLVAKGFGNIEIATQLGLSRRTVSSHLEQVFSKLDVTSRSQATAKALRSGVLSVEDIVGPIDCG